VHFAKKISLLVAGALLFLLSACDSDSDTTEAVLLQDAAPSTVVVFNTNMGDIEVALDEENAPISVANFLAYVDSEFYADTVFHRVIGNFMIQGGGFTQTFQRKTTMDPVENEADNGLDNVKYSIAMARTDKVDSATSQFFINVVDNPFLDHNPNGSFGFSVFGRVSDGFEVVDAIAAVQTRVVQVGNSLFEDVPVEPVIIQSITRK